MNLLKFSAAILVVLGAWVGQAQALELRDIVLMEEAQEFPAFLEFPCSTYIDVVFCGRNLILEKGCKDTLKISPQGLSCRALSGEFVKFAEVVANSRMEDSTQRGVFSHKLKYSSRVQLKAFTTPNGNTEYQLFVK